MSAKDNQIKTNKKVHELPDDKIGGIYSIMSIPATAYNELKTGMLIIDILRNIPNVSYYVDMYGNIIADKGKSDMYPTFVCHFDTVHDYEYGYNVLIQKNHMFAHDNYGNYTGIGGDDKCGIYVCIELLKSLEVVRCVFFSAEEGGGVGSDNIDISIFENSMYIVGIDRWGNSDIVNEYAGNETTSAGFCRDIKAIRKNYGYNYVAGMFTDSINLFQRNVGIVCVNVSCGYYLHHTDNEYIDMNELHTCFLLCRDIALTLDKKYVKYKPVYKAKYISRGKTNYADLSDKCITCGDLLRANEYQWCDDCANKPFHNNHCKYCGDVLICNEEIEIKTCYQCYYSNYAEVPF